MKIEEVKDALAEMAKNPESITSQILDLTAKLEEDYGELDAARSSIRQKDEEIKKWKENSMSLFLRIKDGDGSHQEDEETNRIDEIMKEGIF